MFFSISRHFLALFLSNIHQFAIDFEVKTIKSASKTGKIDVKIVPLPQANEVVHINHSSF